MMWSISFLRKRQIEILSTFQVYFTSSDCWLLSQYPFSPTSPLMGFQFCRQHPCAQEKKSTYISQSPLQTEMIMGPRADQCHGSGSCCWAFWRSSRKRKSKSADIVIFVLCSFSFFLLRPWEKGLKNCWHLSPDT